MIFMDSVLKPAEDSWLEGAHTHPRVGWDIGWDIVLLSQYL